jgi:3-oxo-5-alpha-steroid 4-dehydrogenase 1
MNGSYPVNFSQNFKMMIDTDFIKEFTFYWIISGIVLFPILLFIKQPYGRHMRKGWGLTLPNKIAWLIMELPALTVFVSIIILKSNFVFSIVLPAALWITHYVHRTLVFPFKLKTKGKKMPILIVSFGIIFNFINASLNGISLEPIPVFENFGLQEIRIIAGLLLFAAGMFINVYSDNYLIHLRKSSTNGYKIPQKFLFKLVSCPNFLGEIIEWAGFALVAGNLAALSFLVWTMVNLFPRALNHHKWYKQNFSEYPKNRKALIPFIL